MLKNKLILKDNKKFFILFYLLFFFPYFIDVYFALNTISIPLFLITLIMCILFKNSIFNFSLSKQYKFLIFLFILITFLSSLNSFIIYNNLKPLKSFILLGVFLSSLIIFDYFNQTSFIKIVGFYKIVFFTLVVLGWISYFYDIKLFNYFRYPNNVFPFQEPSHFALAIGNISLPLLVFTGFFLNIFIILNLITLSLLFPSTVLLIYSFLGIIIFFFKKRINLLFKILIFFSFLLFIFQINFDGELFDYFFYRVNPSLSSDQIYNMTNLTYKQGWEFIYINLINTNFLGIGFQMMGSNKMILGDIYRIILNIYPTNYGQNLADGSFVMSKFITEYGFIAIIISFFYFMFILKFIIKFNSKISKIGLRLTDDDEKSKKIFFSELIIFSYFVNFFIRGINYFTPQLIVVFAAIILISHLQKKI